MVAIDALHHKRGHITYEIKKIDSDYFTEE